MKLLLPFLICSLLVLTDGLADPARGKLPRTDRKSFVQGTESNTTNSVNNQAQCPQNDVLSKLLLQLLLSSVTTTTTQNPLVEGLNRLLGINPTPQQPGVRTTVVTSSVVSTVTQLYSTILSVMFKNKRIPTTIFSSSVVVVTELQTVTSTLPMTGPTALFRVRRDGDENQLELLQPSVVDQARSFDEPIQPTRPLHETNEILTNSLNLIQATNEDISYWMAILNHPEVRKAWDEFLEVIQKVRQEV